MTKADFCQTVNGLVCYFQTALNLVPLFTFVILGLYSLRQIRSIEVYSREPYTRRHLVKLTASALLSIISLVFILVYTLTEPEVSIKTAIAWGISCFIWIFNSVLMRKEFQKLGYTTNYLKLAWVIMFLCHTTLIIMGAAGLNTDDFSKIMVIYSLNDFFLLVMVFLGYFYGDDYMRRKRYDAYSSVAITPEIQVDDQTYKDLTPQANRPAREGKKKKVAQASFEPLLANDDLAQRHTGNRSTRKTNSFARESPEQKEISVHIENKSPEIRLSNQPAQQPAQIDLKEEIQNIEDIHVIKTEDVMRGDKLKTLYVIVYHIRGQKFVTKRSYSEFDNLYKEIKKETKNAHLPQMPPKTLILSKTQGVKIDRTEVFDKLLRILLIEKIGLNHLREFLQTPNNVPYYGKVTKRDSTKRVSSKNQSGISKPETSQNKMIDNSPRSDSPVDNSPASSDSSISDNLKSPLIAKTSSRPGEGLNRYRVFAEKIYRGSDKRIYYSIKIIENESGSAVKIRKRYGEFKTFHEQLKEHASKRYINQIPSLPGKGKAGALASSDEPGVTEYRKAMIPRYLQTVLNDPILNGNPAILQLLKDVK